MFQPSRDEVRRFFCEVWDKERRGALLAPIEAMAAAWVRAHPEYHALLESPERALAAEFSIEQGQGNPFAHLAMHLALDEQAGIDQPPGVRAALTRLAERCGDAHAAAHEAMECLGRIVWEAQRGVLPPEPAAINAAYLECLARRATR